MSRTIIRTALAGLALAACGLAYVSAHPLRRTAASLPAPAAQALLAGLVTGAQGTAQAGGPQRTPREVFADTDNVLGLRLRVLELDDRFVAVLTPFSPDPQHAGHMTAPCLPARALVRLESALVVTDYPMTQVGSSWVAAVPKPGLSLLPGDRIWAGAWTEGAGYPDPLQAAYWHWWGL